jgi:hypothetical protein
MAAVRPDDVKTSPAPVPDPRYTDAAAISMAVNDYNSASAWMESKRWPLQWRESDVLYQSPRGFPTFEGSAGTVIRANVQRFSVAKQVNSLAPALSGAVFSDATPFEIRPRPNVTQETAWAWKALISALLETCHFKEEMSYGIESMVNQGTVIFKGGWQTETRIEAHYIRKQAPASVTMPMGPPMLINTVASDEFEAVDEEVTRNFPFFEKCELGTIFPDPKWNKPNQIWKAAWIIDERYVTYDDLKILSQNPDYDIPDEETLRSIFLTDLEPTLPIKGTERTLSENSAVHHAATRDDVLTEDPLLKPMQLLERWTDTEVICVLQQKVVIRNGTHKFPQKPFFSCNFWNMDNAGWGLGVGRITGSDQRVEQGLTNAALDILAFAVNPEYAVLRGANVPTQEQRRRLGGIKMVDGTDARAAYSLIESPRVPPEVWSALQASMQASEASTGADQATVQGSLPPKGSSIARSGTGAGAMAAASAGRLQAPVERVIDGVFIPFLNFLWNMVRERMPISEIRQILGEEMTENVVVDMFDFMTAKLKFETLAGTRLAARARMAQALPFILEVFQNPSIISQLNATGEKVDVNELIGMVMDMSEWRNRRQLVVPMTPQEIQLSQQATNPAAQQLQGKMALQQQAHQGAMELEDQKISGRIAANTIKPVASRLAEPPQPQQGKLAESPLTRAELYNERDTQERAMQASPFFGGGAGV